MERPFEKAKRCPTCHQRTDRATNEQKKRFWALVGLILEKAGEKGLKYTKEDMADLLKLKFLGAKERTLPSGRHFVELPSIAGLDVMEMSNFLDQCQAWAADKGIFLDS